MSYTLYPEVAKIDSPIIIQFPDGSIQRFKNGDELAKITFDTRYLIKRYYAREDTVNIELQEWYMPEPPRNWCGEEAISFF